MSGFPSTKAKKVLAALLRIGWTIKRQTGSHKTLSREGYADIVFAFHDGDEIGPKMMVKIAKNTGLKSQDL
jgi:predicted RNA binding protein YcfA (HicA-like mRNA interferase family)